LRVTMVNDLSKVVQSRLRQFVLLVCLDKCTMYATCLEASIVFMSVCVHKETSGNGH
jgi:hypothetical protein